MRLGAVDIPPASGRAVTLSRGDILRVIDVEGSQVADLVAFDAADTGEHLSQGFTRLLLDRADVRVGDSLVSNLSRPFLTIVEDQVGVHDLLFPPCNTIMYERVFGVFGKTGCREHLAQALTEHGIGFAQITDPFNIFMNARVDEQQKMAIMPPTSRAGNHIDLLAERDLVVAVSACAGDTNDCNGGVLTGIRLEIRRGEAAG